MVLYGERGKQKKKKKIGKVRVEEGGRARGKEGRKKGDCT